MLSLGKVNSFYGAAQVLFQVSLQVSPGEVVVLLGRNGAGKSTTLKTMMGLICKQTGTIIFQGQTISHWHPHQIARLGLGYVPEERRIFTDLTVEENLLVGQQPPRHGVPSWDWDKVTQLFPNLARMPKRLGGNMSGGEQQMLTIARTLMGNPSCILLDEPSEGVAPVIVQEMATAILELRRQGVAILLCEQNVHFAMSVADRAYIMEKGEICFSGSIAELRADAELVSRYLTA